MVLTSARGIGEPVLAAERFLDHSLHNEAKDTQPNGWPWPDSLDALVAAPEHHRLLFENEHVRVLEVRIPPGHLVPVHRIAGRVWCR